MKHVKLCADLRNRHIRERVWGSTQHTNDPRWHKRSNPLQGVTFFPLQMLLFSATSSEVCHLSVTVFTSATVLIMLTSSLLWNVIAWNRSGCSQRPDTRWYHYNAVILSISCSVWMMKMVTGYFFDSLQKLPLKEIYFNFPHRRGVFGVKCIPSLGP